MNSDTRKKLKKLSCLCKKELEKHGINLTLDSSNKASPSFICTHGNCKISIVVPAGKLEHLKTEKAGILNYVFGKLLATAEKYKEVERALVEEMIITIKKSFNINTAKNMAQNSLSQQAVSCEIKSQLQDKRAVGNNTVKKNKVNIPAQLLFYSQAYNKIVTHANHNKHLECGGFLIGNVAQDQVTGAWIGLVEDVYSDNSVGEPSTYTFTPQMTLSALNYCKDYYRDDWDVVKHIIGNYHSHGMHRAFFSETDRKMMHTQATNEFYFVLSPAYRNHVALFMDSDFSPHDVNIFYYKEEQRIRNDFSLVRKKR